ncbi:hypothetical protein SKAU_G00347350 [Synaphobranchus kaupii]|uniref:C2H2-type domain-containing protein n=1 Tax=Synaphobranchus kaupii TaxID=118154 RepID=A0A9Q1EJT5_SYNKA|nr:hypothetical protein SKAU_G00347350 [Synaphobranchus kaupii]
MMCKCCHCSFFHPLQRGRHRLQLHSKETQSLLFPRLTGRDLAGGSKWSRCLLCCVLSPYACWHCANEDPVSYQRTGLDWSTLPGLWRKQDIARHSAGKTKHSKWQVTARQPRPTLPGSGKASKVITGTEAAISRRTTGEPSEKAEPPLAPSQPQISHESANQAPRSVFAVPGSPALGETPQLRVAQEPEEMPHKIIGYLRATL